jgi:hypothetical protein
VVKFLIPVLLLRSSSAVPHFFIKLLEVLPISFCVFLAPYDLFRLRRLGAAHACITGTAASLLTGPGIAAKPLGRLAEL